MVWRRNIARCPRIYNANMPSTSAVFNSIQQVCFLCHRFFFFPLSFASLSKVLHERNIRTCHTVLYECNVNWSDH